jgi:hypothetical protein
VTGSKPQQIVLDASGVGVIGATDSNALPQPPAVGGFFVNPVRTFFVTPSMVSNLFPLYYDSGTGEIMYYNPMP